ncbi:MAG TPA: heme ABC exporter ATP-binding protein CcmA [Nevskiaceae bacterium]|nr:heme ABC exporter ATP-binding protein CcmA [Nevskiaceae bacterium]
MEPLLLVQGLAVRRGDRLLLRDLDLRLQPGERLHLRGANGIGKSSLLECLAGLRTAEAGQVVRRAPLHWLGHRHGVNLALSPLENLGYAAALLGAGEAAVLPALEQLGLGRQRHRPCAQLSAGQRRRTALARLLLSRRPLWLLDEPLAGLDAEGIERVGALLDAHLASGGAVLLTSHQPLPGRLGVFLERSLTR